MALLLWISFFQVPKRAGDPPKFGENQKGANVLDALQSQVARILFANKERVCTLSSI